MPSFIDYGLAVHLSSINTPGSKRSLERRSTNPAVRRARKVENERRPAVEQDALFEDETVRPVGRERRAGLARQEPRQDHARARLRADADRSCEPLELAEHDIGEYEIERRAGAQPVITEPVRPDDRDMHGDMVEPGIVARDAHADRIDVARDHPA